MSDLKLTTSHDIDLSTGDLQLLNGLEETQQRLTIAFGTYLGEYYFDSRVGIPYYQTIFRKRPNVQRIKSILRARALLDPAISEVREVTVDYDANTRAVQIGLNMRDTSGGIVDFTLPAILEET